jgi:nicotinamidase-related amidase
MDRKHMSYLIAGVAVGVVAVGVLRDGGAVPAAQAQPAAASATRAKTWGPAGKHERLTTDNCVFAFIDHQTGLMNLVDNARAVEFKNIVIGLAKTAKIQGVPTVITTSAPNGPNGPFMPEVLKILPDAPVIDRPGQVNAWDNADFVAAIEKTGRRKIVMSGITTDVCVAFAALSALDAGYEVYVVVDASGSMNADNQNAAIMRMADAGAIIGTWFAINMELMVDWRNPTGAATAELLVEHMPSYGEVFHSHQSQAAAAGGSKK